MITQAAFALMLGAKEIRVALAAAGIRIASLLTDRHPPPEVDGQPLFDYGRQVEHLIYELESAENGVTAAEDAHMKQEVRQSRLRTERDLKAGENFGKLVAARQGFEGLQGGKGGFETVFVSGAAPRSPERLVKQLGQSVTLLNDPAVEPRSLRVAGFDIDYSSVAGDLESGRLDLQDTIDRLAEETKRAEGTMLARRQAIEELKSTVIWAGRSAEGLFERAGESELAKRIRSSTRRPLRPSEEKAAEEQASDDPRTSAGEPASVQEPASDESASAQQPTPASEPVFAGEPSTQEQTASDLATDEPASEPVSGPEERQSSDS